MPTCPAHPSSRNYSRCIANSQWVSRIFSEFYVKNITEIFAKFLQSLGVKRFTRPSQFVICHDFVTILPVGSILSTIACGWLSPLPQAMTFAEDCSFFPACKLWLSTSTAGTTRPPCSRCIGNPLMPFSSAVWNDYTA